MASICRCCTLVTTESLHHLLVKSDLASYAWTYFRTKLQLNQQYHYVEKHLACSILAQWYFSTFSV